MTFIVIYKKSDQDFKCSLYLILGTRTKYFWRSFRNLSGSKALHFICMMWANYFWKSDFFFSSLSIYQSELYLWLGFVSNLFWLAFLPANHMLGYCWGVRTVRLVNKRVKAEYLEILHISVYLENSYIIRNIWGTVSTACHKKLQMLFQKVFLQL